jgi:hypothetical protein
VERALLFLDGIIEVHTLFFLQTVVVINTFLQESMSHTEFRIVPHGSLGIGNLVVFRVVSTSNRLKKFNGDLTMRSNDTVMDLLKAVAKQFQVNCNEVKMFRLGKEILQNEFSKLISQLRQIGK